MLASFTKSLDELAWRFHSAEASIGIRATDITEGGGSGGSVFDASASERLHLSFRKAAHRHNVQQLVKVDTCLSQLEPGYATALQLAFSPTGRASSTLAAQFQISVGDMGQQKVCVLGYALRSRAMRIAYASHHETVVAPDQDTVMAWLETEAKPEALKRVVSEVLGEIELMVAQYDERRIAREAVEEEQRRQREKVRERDLAEWMARHHRKLWGEP